ncbi:MAG TPA: Mpo1-like protein [Isosphaeraceae bacterium]|nr:Mpo1-like protein [Isosphaeraceae bacterium]
MLCPPHPPAPIVVNWLERHRDPRNFALHMIGIPLTIMGLLVFPVFLALLSFPVFLLGIALFFGGYAIQFSGHLIDGTEPGEWTALRKWLGRKFGRFAPPPGSRQQIA